MNTLKRLAIAAALVVAIASCKHSDTAQAGGSGAEPRGGGFSGSAFTPHENLEVKIGLPPAAVPAAGTVNGAAVDKEDYKVALVTCALNDTTAGTSITTNVDESDTGSSGWTAVTGATFTPFTNARDNGVYYGSLDLRPRKQFLRLTEVTVGTFTTSFRACNFTFGAPTNAPTTWAVATPDFNVR